VQSCEEARWGRSPRSDPSALLREIREIITQLLLGEPIGRSMEVAGQTVDGFEVRPSVFPGPIRNFISAIMRHLSSVITTSLLANIRWASSGGKPTPARIDRTARRVGKRDADAIEKTARPLLLLKPRDASPGCRSKTPQDARKQLPAIAKRFPPTTELWECASAFSPAGPWRTLESRRATRSVNPQSSDIEERVSPWILALGRSHQRALSIRAIFAVEIRSLSRRPGGTVSRAATLVARTCLWQSTQLIVSCK